MYKIELQTRVKQFTRDNYYRWSIRISLFLIIFASALLLYFWQKLPPQIPFYYSLTWGEEQLAPNISLIFLLSGLLITCLINLIMAFFLHIHLPFYSKLLLVGSSCICFLTVFTLINIILLMI